MEDWGFYVKLLDQVYYCLYWGSNLWAMHLIQVTEYYTF